MDDLGYACPIFRVDTGHDQVLYLQRNTSLRMVNYMRISRVDCLFWAKKSDGPFDPSLISPYGVVLARYDQELLFHEGTSFQSVPPDSAAEISSPLERLVYHDPVEVVNSENDPTVTVNNCNPAGCCDFNDPEATISFTNCCFGKPKDYDAAYCGVYSYAKNTPFTNCSFTEDSVRDEEDNFFNGIYFGNNMTVEMNGCTLADSTDGLADLCRKEPVNNIGLAAIANADNGDTIPLGEGNFATYGSTPPGSL